MPLRWRGTSKSKGKRVLWSKQGICVGKSQKNDQIAGNDLYFCMFCLTMCEETKRVWDGKSGDVNLFPLFKNTT